MKIMGIDEAGRGCVIGPMVLGAVVVDKKGWNSLLQIGVRDSKALSPNKRIQLEEKIKKIAISTRISLVPPKTIDQYCIKKLLNQLEAEVAARFIDEQKVDRVYVDAPGKNGRKFKLQLQNALISPAFCEIIAENKADVRYPAVSAASILAKVARDGLIAQLRKQWGDFGSGYPSDQKTSEFLKQFYRQYHCFPDFVRMSWTTIQRIITGSQFQWF